MDVTSLALHPIAVHPIAVHPIEEESYRILHERVDLSAWPAGPAAVVARVVHATADLEYVTTMVVDEAAVEAGVAALRAGAPVVADVKMTRDGITGVQATMYIDSVPTAPAPALAPATAGEPAPTRSALAMRHAAKAHPNGAVFVIGCAPTALEELLRLMASDAVRPALVIGMPVGFVGAVESKEALRRSGIAAITNRGEKGGSAAAAAACNALVRLAAHG